MNFAKIQLILRLLEGLVKALWKIQIVIKYGLIKAQSFHTVFKANNI